MSWLSKQFKSAKKAVVPKEVRSIVTAGWDGLGDFGQAILDNPERLLVGAIDPLSTKMWNKILGRNWDPMISQMGGPSATSLADDEGYVKNWYKNADTAAGVIGGYFAGPALLGAAGMGGGAAGAGAGELGGVGIDAAGGIVGAGEAGLTGGLAGTAGGTLGGTTGGTLAGAGTSTLLPSVVVTGSSGSGLGALGSALGGAGTGGAGAAVAGEAMGPPKPEPPPPKPGVLSQAGAYIKDPENWGTIIKGVGALGSLMSRPGGGGPPPDGNDGTQLPDVPYGQRAYNPYEDDYYTYGSRGAHQFYTTTPPPPQGKAMGGPASMRAPSPLQMLSRAQGNAVRGPGTGRSDDIPAQLSDGEYIIDAETTAMLGDGSSEAGAAKLDMMREAIRKHKGQALAKGKFSPDAKSPLEYLKMEEPMRKAEGGKATKRGKR